MLRKTICLDFDGVCNMYTGWKGDDELFEPRQGLREFISLMVENNKRVAIFSTRPKEKLKSWFELYFPDMISLIASDELFFPDKKPPADVYIDDRGIQFTGQFDKFLIANILYFSAHWENKPKPTIDELEKILNNE